MRKRERKSFFSLMAILVFLFSCENESIENLFPVEGEPLHTIDLRWYQNDIETRAEFEVGMQWCFSFLGAQLPSGSWNLGTLWINDQTLRIDLATLGFNNHALEQFEKLIRLYKASEEYAVTGGIDAGRFVTSIINNSNHYYKIVNMPTTLERFRNNSTFLEKRAAIIESAVAFEERLISMPAQNQNINSLTYWAQELSGSLIDSSQQVEENEVMDIMPNGQVRFGIYNKNGQLIGGGDTSLSIAGKPSKCLWCHEVNIQIGFSAMTAIPGFFSPEQFDSIVQENTVVLNNHRSALSPEINFFDRNEHTKFEKIYIRFMEPSAQRLAQEWSKSISDVESILVNVQTHENDEFPELGLLYYRKEIDQYSPYQVLPSTTEARETVSDEPNLLP